MNIIVNVILTNLLSFYSICKDACLKIYKTINLNGGWDDRN